MTRSARSAGLLLCVLLAALVLLVSVLLSGCRSTSSQPSAPSTFPVSSYANIPGFNATPTAITSHT